METRSITREMDLPADPERVFRMLHTPGEIRGWWSASRAIVMPQPGGTYAVAWGADEDDPDFVTEATIEAFEPPRRLSLVRYRYRARTGPLPFEADFGTEFIVTPTDGGCRLRMTNSGFPVDPAADEFFADCEAGWRDVFEAIRRHLGEGDA